MIKTYIKTSILSLFFMGTLMAQTVNVGELAVLQNTQFATVSDFNNTPTGNVLNDGNFSVYANFNNNGVVTYSNLSKGKTFFIGDQEQLIEGAETANFQNIAFNNTTSLTPFHLAAKITVGNKAEFIQGIINADSYDGRIIFNENAFHSNATNFSFVDGKVEKKGDKMFEFPIGDEIYFRPFYYVDGAAISNVYTTQYFFKNSNPLYNHANKEELILSIDEAEYWNITQDKGSEKTVLSLTLDSNTTPEVFFENSTETELAIVRWDENLSKWINEKGVVSDPVSGGNYSKLITAPVTGYGIFTIAIVKIKNIIPDTDLVIHNAISPNGDGLNDSFLIKGIDKYPDNRVEIYNRWGVKVYDVNSYNESDIMFRGYSDGRTTVNKGEGLPNGTYFYILKYNNGQKTIERTGYLYLSE